MDDTKMHQTPNLPGTGPVTDNPNPGGSQGMDTSGPSTGSEVASDMKTFRCADVGNSDCRWEAAGRTEEELMPKIERHGREAHGISKIDDSMRSKVRDAIRTRAA
jgi:predicted small metal-binding protein